MLLTICDSAHAHSLHMPINHSQVWDLRHNGMVYTMSGHSDTITGLKLSPNGNYILSNSMDNTG